MKVAVYTICKNESQFVDRFMACIKNEADVVVVTDTGSTDDTVEKLRAHGATVYETVVNPWRFDVARNISLANVPEDVDICVCIDLDEVLTPGWKQAIVEAFEKDPEAVRLRYPYIWSTLPDGSPGLTYWYEKIHTRHGWKWVCPVHEILKYEKEDVQTYTDKFKLYHFPDPTKSRSSYLPLLELGCQEDPENDRNSHYLGREYMFYKQYDKAIVELKRHLSLKSATWDAERSASMRYIARCYMFNEEHDNAIAWGLRAVAECSTQREPWVELGKIYYFKQDWSGCYFAMKHALAIKEKPMSYVCEPDSWGVAPHDIISIAAFYLGLKEEALEQCKKALEFQPKDTRLLNNLAYYAKVINDTNVKHEV